MSRMINFLIAMFSITSSIWYFEVNLSTRVFHQTHSSRLRALLIQSVYSIKRVVKERGTNNMRLVHGFPTNLRASNLRAYLFLLTVFPREITEIQIRKCKSPMFSMNQFLSSCCCWQKLNFKP